MTATLAPARQCKFVARIRCGRLTYNETIYTTGTEQAWREAFMLEDSYRRARMCAARTLSVHEVARSQ